MKVTKLLMVATVATLAALPSTVAAQQASFDCAKAATPTEHLICGDKDLGELDVRMARAFSMARNAIGVDKAGLLQQQREWLKRRTNVCGIPDSGRKPDSSQARSWTSCLANQYQQRLAQLKQPPSEVPSGTVTAATAAPVAVPDSQAPALAGQTLPTCDTLASIYPLTAASVESASQRLGTLGRPLHEWRTADFSTLADAYIACRNRSATFLAQRYPHPDMRYFIEYIHEDVARLQNEQASLLHTIAQQQAAEEEERRKREAASAEADRERALLKEYEELIGTLSHLTVDSDEAVQHVRDLEKRFHNELRPLSHTDQLWSKANQVDGALGQRLAEVTKYEKSSKLRARNAETVDPRVKTLDLPKAMLNAKLFLIPYAGGRYEEWGRMDVWLSRLLNNSKLKGPLQSIDYRELRNGDAKGIGIKISGSPTFVILFNLDGGELFPSWAGNIERVEALRSPTDQATIADTMKGLAGGE